MNNIFSIFLAFFDLCCFQILFVNGFTCKIVLYYDKDLGGEDWPLQTNNTLSEIWRSEGGSNFDDNEVSSYEYYCARGYRCTFTFCDENYCNVSWTFDESCAPGGNGAVNQISNNDALIAIYVSISATDSPTTLPTSLALVLFVLFVCFVCLFVFVVCCLLCFFCKITP